MSRETAFQKFAGKSAPPPPRGSVQPPPRVEAAPAPNPQIQDPPQPKVETTEAGVSTPKTDELQSTRLAILAKKESAIQKERESFKKEREDWLKEKAEVDGIRKRANDFEETRKKDPIAALKQLGFSDTEIINAINGQEKAEPNAEEIAKRVAAEETQKIRDEIAKEKQELEKSTNERMIGNLKADISLNIKKQAEKYEFCAFEGKAAEDQAYSFIVQALKADPNDLISVDEALEMTETLYEERAKALQKLKKLQPQTPLPVEEPAPVGRSRAPISNVPQPEQIPQTRKIGTIPPPPSGRQETREEKKERLIRAIQTGGLSR